MKTIEIISQDLFDKVRSRFTNLQMGDEQGGVTMDPRQARFYDFDFTIEGHNLGRVSISINELGTLKVFYGQSILEDIDPVTREYWYDFLREMRNFAKRRLLRFDTRDITKSNLDKTDFQYLATNGSKEENMNMNESAKFEGSKKTSYRKLEKTKLIAKHRNSIEDESFGARSRASNIKALYIENSEGERFKYPFVHIAGAKAMQRHVANGGRPYDDAGKAIIRMSEQMAQLSAFKRHIGHHDGMNQEVNEIADRANMKLETLRNTMNHICNQSAYENWVQTVQPVQEDGAELDQATFEDYKSKFTVSSFREDLAQYFPLIHSIMKEAGELDLESYVQESDKEYCDACDRPASECVCDTEVKESDFDKFTTWADRVSEGFLEPDAVMALKDLLDTGLTLGADGTSAIEALQGIGIVDDVLERTLAQMAKANPNADPKPIILGWLAKDDPEAAKELGYGQGEDQLDTEPEDNKQPSIKELAEWLGGFYNRDFQEQGFESPWRKGVTELSTMAEKQFGPGYGKLVEKLVSEKTESALDRIAREGSIRNADRADEVADEPGPSSAKSPLTTTDNPHLPKGPEQDEGYMEDILKLAGLAK